ncbi:hypothetical protein HYALB_00009890 [Hymenoscyphus albidus]|uniref:Glycoside hydrolase 131 catalytic N-terminal domain-containing protein n=1 Tax=Hymenoscyphus albidus TaxID=595503 RepID=A0A9N9LYD3_9HELO|nr:hypothetical protein HYALB_00009890 [Hymenoscyphus albidus]
MHKSVVFLAILAKLAVGIDLVDRQVTKYGYVVWDGRFLDHNTTDDIAGWSWNNRDGYAYQWYKHGPGVTDEYLAFDPKLKNPADLQSKVGVKMTVTETSYWTNWDNVVEKVRRTNLIPEGAAAIDAPTPVGTGLLYYHFSILRSIINPLDVAKRHKFAFFEPEDAWYSPLPYFTELVFGGAAGKNLTWNVANQSHWTAPWEIDVWQNFAYAIDFTEYDGHITLYYSTGGNDLVAVSEVIKTNTESTGHDWCIGQLVEPDGDYVFKEDVYYSGV